MYNLVVLYRFLQQSSRHSQKAEQREIKRHNTTDRIVYIKIRRHTRYTPVKSERYVYVA